MSDDEFRPHLRPLMEVKQRGQTRAATPADLLELLEVGGRRYLLRGTHGYYLARDGKGWTDRQRKALVIDDVAVARGARSEARKHRVEVKVVRIRRPGTCGIEGVRLRPDLKVAATDERIEFDLTPADAMQFFASLKGAKDGEA